MEMKHSLIDRVVLNNQLFSQWTEELSLRRQLRNSAHSPYNINDIEDVELLWRSLYFSGQKEAFFSQLAENMHLAPVLNWLTANEARLIEFLTYLPDYLRRNIMEIKKLQYLLNLYSEKLNHHFTPVIAALDTSTCELLAARSANPQWRKLIHKHLQYLKEKKNVIYYGIDEQIYNSTFPTIQGDKIVLLTTGIELIQISMAEDIEQDPRYNMILGAADNFFKAGMIGESLVLLIELYKNVPVELSRKDDYLFKRQFSKLLRNTAAIYSLINRPDAAGYFAASIYQNYFPFFLPDIITQKYLHIYALIKYAKKSTANYELYKIAYMAEQISQDRADEFLLLSKSDIDHGLNKARQAELESLVEQKLVSLPHEAFVSIQLLQLLIERQLADASMANFLLNKSLLLFQWVPSSLFINHSWLESVAPMVSDESRYDAGKIVEQMELFNQSDILAGVVQKSGLFKSKDAAILRQLAAGKFLGVL
jgi:hypothetical protein